MLFFECAWRVSVFFSAWGDTNVSSGNPIIPIRCISTLDCRLKLTMNLWHKSTINYELMVSSDLAPINTPTGAGNVRTVLGQEANYESLAWFPWKYPFDPIITLNLDLRPSIFSFAGFSRKLEISTPRNWSVKDIRSN